MLQSILSERPIAIRHFSEIALKCWVFDRYKKMRLNAFTRDEQHAHGLIANLIDKLPDSPEAVALHINSFIEDAVESGFVNEEGHRDLAGAATLASLILTTRYPAGFTDYPSHKRWRYFVSLLGYTLPEFTTHGERIVWVSEFAQYLVEQITFRLNWPDIEPMWVASALCWANGRNDSEQGVSKSDPVVPYLFYADPVPNEFEGASLAELKQRAIEKACPQAARHERLNNIYSRSHAIKAYALKRANGVCEGCSKPAPFTNASGMPFLEVHHLQRLADGGPDSPEAVIALCPNCHRKAHYADNADEFNNKLKEVVQRLEAP